MYIPEFWAGVLATILAEIAFIVVAGLIKGGKKNGDQ